MSIYLLSIDQGTTNSRAIIFDQAGFLVAQHDLPVTNYFPKEGWVEQNPEEMLQNTVTCCREVMKKIQLSAGSIAAIGISNQRETTIVWHKDTGRPIYPAIVWQDRRTSDICSELARRSDLRDLPEKTGLLLDPYFSATKIMWILEHVRGAREQAERGELLFGTVDTYLIWKLTGGKSHVTDITNASRTMLLNIHTQQWDTEILQALGIPPQLLPKVLENAADFGVTDPAIFGSSMAITGVAGDQQAATVGQACFSPGMIKATYGTGCFMVLNTGNQAVQSRNRLLTTIAYRIQGETAYALEGSIFCAGATIKWLRDTLKLIQTAEESERFARSISDNSGVYFVPAFTGLGAPYWDPYARAAIQGLTRDSQAAHIVRGALESVAYQSKDLLLAMLGDVNVPLEIIRVDGGMTANAWLLQFTSNMLDVTMERPQCIETSALGAAFLAGLGVGLYQSLEDISALWTVHSRFEPTFSAEAREKLYEGWKRAVARISKQG